jgi:hypothetical protein
MRCKNCDEQLPDSANFCLKCGNPTNATVSEKATSSVEPYLLAEGVIYKTGYSPWGNQAISGKLIADIEGLHFFGIEGQHLRLSWSRIVQGYGYGGRLLPPVRWDERQRTGFTGIATDILDAFLPSSISLRDVAGLTVTYRSDAGDVSDIFFQCSVWKIKKLVQSILAIREQMLVN